MGYGTKPVEVPLSLMEEINELKKKKSESIKL